MKAALLVLRAELERLARSRAAWALLVVVAALSAARAAATIALAGRAGATLDAGGAWAPFVDGWSLGLALTAAITLVAGALILASDLENGVVRLTLTRSAGRGSLLVGRCLLAPFVALPLACAAGFGAWASARLGAGGSLDFGALVEEGYQYMSAAEVWREVELACASSALGLLGLWALGLAVATLARSAAWAVALALGGWLAFDQLKRDLLGDDAYWFFPSHVPSPEDASAFAGLAAFVRGASDALPADEHMTYALLAPALGVPLVLLGAWTSLARRRL
ncbi:MAG: hypothetical protein WD226_13380 [Planctomycetota bacterium]